MDVEKTVEFLLEQQASAASQMSDVRTVLHELAVNQVALGKAQTRTDETVRQLGLAQTRTDETVRQLGQRVDQLVEALQNRLGSNGTGG